ncbi:hypothetical protein [Burkholderia ubonensis]|uniref:hypothetical protein n=1 Tax=Burkholderia ubonensis TaxID=101571 RepID=UPI0012FCA4D1|nr:hypothetical protein [Burkholderia ubonensis]
MRKILHLSARSDSGLEGLGGVVEPVWGRIETCINQAFEYGGQVTLSDATVGPDEKISLGVSLGMMAHPKQFRLIYSPLFDLKEKSKIREWWEPGDEPFRGTTNFFDHEWDDRTVCRDISVALEMFRDFYEHHDLTEVSLKQTRSVWDRKPR